MKALTIQIVGKDDTEIAQRYTNLIFEMERVVVEKETGKAGAVALGSKFAMGFEGVTIVLGDVISGDEE